MILKNLLTNTEKPTRILRCRIALRLRSVICILIFSICILLGLNSCFGQQFQSKLVVGLYGNTDFVKNLKPNQAILSYTFEPGSSPTINGIYTINDISKGVVNLSQYTFSAAAGRYYTTNERQFRHQISLIDSEFLYVQSNANSTTQVLIPKLQEKLEEMGLGSVQSRSAYIQGLDLSHNLISVSPYDFRSNLQSWIIVGLVIAILIPAWYLCRRFLRG